MEVLSPVEPEQELGQGSRWEGLGHVLCPGF